MQNKKIIFLVLYGFFSFLMLEITSRTFIALRMKVPFFKPGEIIYKFYPQLRSVKESDFYKKSEYYDILFLGASTLHKDWGSIEEIMLHKLENKINKKVRIFNLAYKAFSSLDSYYIYRHLKSKKFDLVLLYDGINEVRANNCPPAIFKDDYSHYSWYELINTFEAHKEINFLTFPYLLHKLSLSIYRRYNNLEYVPTDAPIKSEWTVYGCDIKTAKSFENNERKILEIASKKKEAVLLMTTAFYIPEGYTYQMFRDKLLDYGTHTIPIEVWGNQECVKKGVRVHNQIIRQISSYSKNTIFIDQNNFVPKTRVYFSDICHLSDKGGEVFVDNIIKAISRSIK